VTKALLSDAVTDYMVLRGSQDFSKNTLANESGVLRRFLAVNGNIWVHQIGERQTIRYFEEASKTRSPRSQQLDFTVLSTVLRLGTEDQTPAVERGPDDRPAQAEDKAQGTGPDSRLPVPPPARRCGGARPPQPCRDRRAALHPDP
jgi:hypothetical protein